MTINYALKLMVNENTALIHPTLEMSNYFFEVLDSDREHLRTFLDFVDSTTEAEKEKEYLRMKLTGVANGTDRLYFITYQGKLAGCIDLHEIDEKNQKAEIGYWLHSSYTRKGIMSDCVKKVCEISFEEIALNKLTIIADVENMASNGVAKRCGFSLVGTDREDILMYGEFRDMNKYSLLKADFNK